MISVMKKLLLIPVLMMLLFAGCRSSQPLQNNYFLLELPTAFLEETRSRVGTIDATCELQKIVVAPAYASHQIAIREDTHRMRYFSFNEWAYRPEMSLTNMAYSFLDQGRFFREIVSGRLQDTPDYILHIKVHRMEVDHQTDAFVARLYIEFSLSDTATGKVVVHHDAQRNRTLEENSLNLFAAAVSDFFTEELDAFMNQVLNNFND